MTIRSRIMLTFGVLLVLSLAVSCHCAAITDPCGTGWEQFKEKCYYFSQKALSWDDALEACKDVGGHLARVNNTYEMGYLGGKVKSKRLHHWVDGTDRRKEGLWIWETTDLPIVYFNWSPGNPNNSRGKEDCLEIMTNQKNNDDSCLKRQHFICEKSRPRKC